MLRLLQALYLNSDQLFVAQANPELILPLPLQPMQQPLSVRPSAVDATLGRCIRPLP